MKICERLEERKRREQEHPKSKTKDKASIPPPLVVMEVSFFFSIVCWVCRISIAVVGIDATYLPTTECYYYRSDQQLYHSVDFHCDFFFVPCCRARIFFFKFFVCLFEC